LDGDFGLLKIVWEVFGNDNNLSHLAMKFESVFVLVHQKYFILFWKF